MWSNTRFKYLAMALILTLVFGGTAFAVHEGESDVPKRYTGDPLAGLKGPDAEGQAVWTYITKDKPYTNWPLWPGKGKLYQGKEPHGMLLTTYVSEDAKKIINKKAGEFDYGAFIVKENYKPDKTLAAVTVMYKVKGYNPEAGDWFWAKYNPDGSIDKEGKVGGCINCHRNASDNDWVFTGPIK